MGGDSGFWLPAACHFSLRANIFDVYEVQRGELDGLLDRLPSNPTGTEPDFQPEDFHSYYLKAFSAKNNFSLTVQL